ERGFARARRTRGRQVRLGAAWPAERNRLALVVRRSKGSIEMLRPGNRLGRAGIRTPKRQVRLRRHAGRDNRGGGDQGEIVATVTAPLACVESEVVALRTFHRVLPVCCGACRGSMVIVARSARCSSPRM